LAKPVLDGLAQAVTHETMVGGRMKVVWLQITEVGRKVIAQ
jgi:hypothetical protein